MPAVLLRFAPWIVGGVASLFALPWGAKQIKKAASSGKDAAWEIMKTVGMLAVVPAVFFLGWFFWPKGSKGGNGLYQMGYLLLPAPQGREMDASYLAGRMKRMREDSKNDLLKGQGTALGGLKLEGVQATFGKQREWGNKYERNY